MIYQVIINALMFTVTSALPVEDLYTRMIDAVPVQKPIPWLVSIRDPLDNHNCGGSLIAENTVLTAAHCFQGAIPQYVQHSTVFANRLSSGKVSPDEVKFDILSVTFHPSFVRLQANFDIAVLKLRPTAESKNNTMKLKYVKLDNTNAGFPKSDPGLGAAKAQSLVDQAIVNTGFDLNNVTDKNATMEQVNLIQSVATTNPLNELMYVAGWGSTNENGTTEEAVLREAPMRITTQERCTKYAPEVAPDTIVCGVGANFNSDPCSGDSGGPFFARKDGKETLVGIVSFSKKGCSYKETFANGTIVQQPTVYTRVSFYVENFIKDVLSGKITPSIIVQE